MPQIEFRENKILKLVNVLSRRVPEQELPDKGGNQINLHLGMLGECRIKYDETTWLNWIIEQVVGKLY